MSSFDKKDLLKLAEIVRSETGNDVQEKNFSMLESRLRGHMAKLGIETLEKYWVHFKDNEKTEREVLQSLMTTHYTFFFREYAHFEVLLKWLSAEGSRLQTRFAESKRPVRVWSAACSRGQEVYSLAMFLEVHLARKLGVPFEIVGTDIDATSVSYAKNGVYPIKEVNTIPQEYLNPFWKRGTGPIKDFAAVHPELKKRVRFDALNLLEAAQWAEKDSFDVIFCRNVFIYFSPENVRKIALSLVERLDKDGLFVSGISEPLRFDDWPLKGVGPSCYGRSKPETQAPNAGRPDAGPTRSPSPAPSPEANYRVLCVDDSATIQLLIKKIFSQDPGCAGVDVAGNGKEARQKLDAGKYDLVTLDIHMPEVNGIEFLETLYRRDSDPPVLMVSSVNRTDLELATKSLSLGAFDYVEKPAMNNLQKSADEILTKAKMALRSGRLPTRALETSFDASIAQKIVIPDASQCLRIVFASGAQKALLEQVVRGQKNEYRSPALIIVWKDENGGRIEPDVMGWTERSVAEIRDGKQLFRPNTVYVSNFETATEILAQSRVKSLSVQILSSMPLPKAPLGANVTIQVLLDERLAGEAGRVERDMGIKVSDITPATSFPSLSVEFFAHLRKAAA